MLTKNDLFPIGIGTWGIGGLAEKDFALDKNKQVDALTYMFQQGMNYVEANLWYAQGYSAEILAEAFKKSGKKRDEIFIVQAVYLKDNKLQDTESEIERLLNLFNTDYIDTLQYTQSTFLDYKFDEVCETANNVLTSGKSRFVSITNENLELLITKSENKAHIDEHLAAIDLKLDQIDVQKLEQFTPPGYSPPKVDWDKTGDGVRIDQISNVFDEAFDK